LAVLAVVPAFAVRTRNHHAATTGHSHTFRRGAPKAVHRLHGQQAIDPERVTQIQQALIRAHYLTGDANGKWDSTTEAAMQKYQADQGWQTKLMPDSRALLKLGLGPDYSTAINAKGSTFAAPPPVNTIPMPQVDGFASAAGVSR
jgi:peptidoglycan hydrolase-like protein with peptidoglycan-binding domain